MTLIIIIVQAIRFVHHYIIVLRYHIIFFSHPLYSLDNTMLGYVLILGKKQLKGNITSCCMRDGVVGFILVS